MKIRFAAVLFVCLLTDLFFGTIYAVDVKVESISKNKEICIPCQAWTIGLDQQPEIIAQPTKPGLKNCGPYQGVPLGGFGTGGIGRSYRGSFGRWTIKSGALKNFCLPVNMFSVRTRFDGEEPSAMALHPGYPKLRPGSQDMGRTLSAWDWSYSGKGASYHALYPKAWYCYPAYDELTVDLVCEQFSPILPGQYRETGLPVGVFNWRITNSNNRPVEVSLMFSFANMVGWFNDFDGNKPARKNAGSYNQSVTGSTYAGVLMGRKGNDLPMTEGLGQFCIAAALSPDYQVSTCSSFLGNKAGEDVWQDFVVDGMLNDVSGYEASMGEELAGALCVKMRLEPGETQRVPMALSWDLPLIQFGNGREHWRHYTHYFDRSGGNAELLAVEALNRFPEWSRTIDEWQREVIGDNPDMPDSFFSLLFNESYLAIDGLTVWTDGTREHPGQDTLFGVIECPDYSYYCTLDLWVYGSFYFLKYWPELEKSVIRHFANGVLKESDSLRRCLAQGTLYKRNVKGAAPHDLGNPHDDPFCAVNNYNYQNPNNWKDLNCQFVLNVYRDVVFLKDTQLLKDTWPAVKEALQYLKRFDTDGDGLIENDGTPDQTMDTIPMKGPSSYCGGLWLGAVHAAVKMAEQLGDKPFVEEWQPIAASACNAFEEKLWTGTHYRLDGDGDYPDALYTDGLFGIWFARMCGLTNLIPEVHYREHLKKVYQRNFVEYGGAVGAVNITGWGASSSSDDADNIFSAEQVQSGEVLYGLNLSFAGQLLDAGLHDEANALLDALYDTVYRKYGLWFQSPAAWTQDAKFRAIINLRPFVIWAMAR